jgi:type I restriction enzyme S subunit
MTFEHHLLGEFIKIEKGMTYKGEFLSEDSEVGLIGMDSFVPGGGYKHGSEKPYDGPHKAKNTANAGDLIICCTDVTQDGSVLAAPLLVPEDLGGYSSLLYSHHVGKVVEIKEGLRQEFIYNFLRIPINRIRLAYGDTGTTVRALPYEVVYEQLIPVPKLYEQDQINSFIATLDRKIELNIAMATTLERITNSIFRSWFIDFDPVKTKMSGEKPRGMDDATAALFPDSMEDSELGPIPKNWEVATVGDVLVKQKPGKLYDQKTSMREGLVPVLDQGRSGVVGYHNDAPGYVATPDNPVVVFANHTCTLRFVSYPFSVIQNVFPILGNELSVYWLYFALQGKQDFDSYKGHWPDLVIKPVVKPTQILAEAFERLTTPLLKQMWNLEKENQSLVQLRDSLLPRLISGELQIPEKMLVS